MVYLKLALLVAVFAHCKYSVTCGGCPAGWIHNAKANKCWKFTGKSDSVERGQRICEMMGGTLPMPKTNLEQQELVNFRNDKVGRKNVWIGLNDKKKSWVWQFDDGQVMKVAQWNGGEPNHGGIWNNEHCVHLEGHTPGRWNDRKCSDHLKIVCEYDMTKARDERCPVGWTVSVKANKCFIDATKSTSWHKAKAKCNGLGGTLPMPKSVAIQEGLVQFRNAKIGKSNVWIGLNDLSVNLKPGWKFAWDDSTPLIDAVYTFWNRGEPNNGGIWNNEHCVHLDGNTQGGWNDRKCSDSLSVICEKDIAGPVIILNRVNGMVNFDRNLADYNKGFGHCNKGDCWLGLKSLHNLCSKNCKLEVTMTFKGKTYHSNYNTFTIGPQSDKYRMKIGGHSGNVNDDLAINNGMQFSTKNSDNDKWAYNCAKTFTGGWWYKGCHWAHPTGTWGTKAMGHGIVWKSLTTQGHSLSSITMKVTPTK